MSTLGEECEFDHYIQSLRSSSNRVRYVVITLAVASILVFLGFKNSHYSWSGQRFGTTRLALQVKEHLDPTRCRQLEEVLAEPYDHFPEHLANVQPQALRYAATRACANSRRELRSYLATYWDLYSEDVARITVPVLGLTFDANDLGIVGGLSFSLLFILLWLSLARELQNLVLCLWKVRQIANEDDPRAIEKANFLYHALVMTQVTSHPPTLPRPNPTGLVHLVSRLLLFIPFVLELSIFAADYPSRKEAEGIAPALAAQVALSVEVLACVFLFVAAVFCWIYSRASTRKWRRTFVDVNSETPPPGSTPHKLQPAERSWFDYVELRTREAGREAAEPAAPETEKEHIDTA